MAFLDMFGGPLAGQLSNLLGGNRNMNSQSNNNYPNQNNMLAGPMGGSLSNMLGGNNNMNPQQNNNISNGNNQGSFFGGTPAQTQQIPKYGQNQSDAINQLLSMGLGGLQNLKPFDFEPIEAQARNDYNTKTAPTIAERFTAMGSGPRSSNYAPAVAAAGANLERDLAALRANIGLQQQGQQQGFLQNLVGMGLTPQFESLYTPQQPGFAESAGAPLLQGLAQSLPYLLPLLLGGATGGASTAASAGLPLLLQLLRSS